MGSKGKLTEDMVSKASDEYKKRIGTRSNSNKSSGNAKAPNNKSQSSGRLTIETVSKASDEMGYALGKKRMPANNALTSQGAKNFTNFAHQTHSTMAKERGQKEALLSAARIAVDNVAKTRNRLLVNSAMPKPTQTAQDRIKEVQTFNTKADVEKEIKRITQLKDETRNNYNNGSLAFRGSGSAIKTFTDSMQAYDKRLEELEQIGKGFDYYNTLDDYLSVKNNSDFEEYYQLGKKKYPQAENWSSVLSGNDDAKKVYYYIAGKQGQAFADEFLGEYNKYFAQQMNAENNQKIINEYVNPFAENIPGVSDIASIPMSLGGSVFSNLYNIANYLQYKTTGKYQPVNTNTAPYAAMNAADTIRNTRKEQIYDSDIPEGLKKPVGFLYDTGMSMGESALTFPLGPIGAPLMQGLNAAGRTGKDSLERGAYYDTALANALAAGIFETGAEKLGFDRIHGYFRNPTAKNIVGSMISEALEEGATEVADSVADTLIMKEKSNYAISYQEYLNAGYTPDEARNKALLDLAKQVGASALGGGIMGGVFGSVSTAAGYRQAKSSGQRLVQDADVDTVIEAGLDADKNSGVYKLAQKIKNDIDSGKPVNTYELGALADGIVEYGMAHEAVNFNVEQMPQVAYGDRENAVDIQGIKHVENGKVYVDINQDGKNISVKDDDLIFNDEQTQRLYEMAGEFDMNGARAFRANYDENMNMDSYYKAFKDSYDTGYINLDVDQVSDIDKMILPSNIRYNAWLAGQNDAAQIQKLKSADNFVDAKSAGIVKDELSMQLKTGVYEAVDALSKATGVKVVFEETIQEGKANGYYANGELHIAMDSEDPVMTVFKHEFTHHLQRTAPEQYAAYRNYVIDYFKNIDDIFLEEQIAENLGKYQDIKQAITRGEAMDEIVADATEMFLTDEKAIRELVKENKNIAQRFVDFIHNVIDKVSEIVRKAGFHKKESLILYDNLEKFKNAEKLWLNAISESSKANTKKTDNATSTELKSNSKIQYMINQNFKRDYDNWDKKKRGIRFKIGNTSSALQSIGIMQQNIYLDSTKLVKIRNKHSEMTDLVIKHLPEILENPMIIMESITKQGRVTMFGNIYSANKTPVLVVLELEPRNKNGLYANFIKIASAYGKDGSLQNFIDKCKILYVDANSKRTNGWLRENGLQLPVHVTTYGPIAKVSYTDEYVKQIKGKQSDKSSDSKTVYSLKTLKNGFQYVSIDNEIVQDIPVKERPRFIQRYMLDRYQGKVIGTKNQALFTRKSSEEYAHPRKRLSATAINTKYNAATELDNLMDASVFLRHEDNYKGGHDEAVYGWDKYGVVFKAGKKFFAGEVSVMLRENDRMFYDLTKIKDITSIFQQKMYSADMGKSQLESDIFGESISTGTEKVNIQSNKSSGIKIDDLTKYSLKHQQVIQEYMEAVDPELLDTALRLKNEKYQGKMVRYKINDVSVRQAEDIKSLVGIDISNYQNAINSSTFQHIEKRHGENGKHDHSMADPNDLARMGYVLENYDNIELLKTGDQTVVSAAFRDSNNNPPPLVRYSKAIDGTYYVVEAAMDNKWKKLWIVSAYIQKRGTSQESNANTALNTTSETHLATVPSTDSITLNSQNYNEKGGTSRVPDADSHPQLYARSAHAAVPSKDSISPEDLNNNKKFSLKGNDKTSYEELLNQNDNLKSVNEELQKQLNTYRNVTPDIKVVSDSVNEILRKYHSSYGKENLVRMLQNIMEYSSQNEVSVKDIHGYTALLAKDILEESKVLDKGLSDNYKEMRSKIRNTGLTLSESDRADMGDYNSFRRSNFGRLKLVNDGIPVDSFYQELAGEYPEFFDAGAVTHPADQLLSIAEAMETTAPHYVNPYHMDMEATANVLAHELFDEYFRRMSSKYTPDANIVVNTYESKIDQLKESYKAKYENRITELRRLYRDSENRKLQDVKSYYKNRMGKQRSKMLDMMGYYSDRLEKQRIMMKDRRIAQDSKARIIKDVKEMSKWLGNPTDQKHIPESLRGVVAEFLSYIDFSSDRMNQYGEKTQNTKLWEELQLKYQAIIDGNNSIDGGQFMEVDPALPENLAGFAASIRNIEKLSKMNGVQLEELSHIVAAVKKSISDANKLLANSRYENIVQMTTRFHEDFSTRAAKKVSGGVRKILDDMLNVSMLDSKSYFHQLGVAGESLFEEVRSGFDRKIVNTKMAADYMSELIGEVDVYKWTGKHAKATRFEVSTGDVIELTPAQVMSLYLLNKREQARGHIYSDKGGIKPTPEVHQIETTIAGVKVHKTGIKKTYYPVKVKEFDVSNIIDSLSPEQKKIADGISDFFKDYTSKWGNEVSLQMYGYEKFKAEDYFPIVSDRNYLLTRDGDMVNQESTLKNLGMTKSTVDKANNPIIIEDIFDVFTRQADQMGSYNAFVIPLSDLQKFYNYKYDGAGSVKEILEKTMGTKGKAYIHQLLVDINGSARQGVDTELSNRLLSNMKAASVGANLRVIVQQPTAIVRASAVIDPKYLLMGTVKRGNFDRVKKYAPIAQWKDWGFFEMDTGRQMKQIFMGVKGIDRLKEFTMAGAGAADNITWTRIWNAVEYETLAKHPDLAKGSEEFYQTVGKRFSEIIDSTQVVDSVLHRSQMMRSKDVLTKMATSFMAEPTKSYNMLRTALADMIQNRTPEHRRTFARSVATYVFTALATSAAAGLIDVFRDRDEDETLAEKYYQALATNMLDNMNPLNLIPYAKDIMSMLDGHDVIRQDMSGISDMIKSFSEWQRYFSGESKYTVNHLIQDTAGSMSKVLGIPLKNAMRTINNLKDTIIEQFASDEVKYQNKSFKYSVMAEQNYSGYIKDLLNARFAGNDALAIEIANDLIEVFGNEKVTNSIESGSRSRLAETEDIKSLYEAMRSFDLDAYDRIRNNLLKDGFDTKAIKSALNTYQKSLENEDEALDFNEITSDYFGAIEESPEDNELYNYNLLYAAKQAGNKKAYDAIYEILQEQGKQSDAIMTGLLAAHNRYAKEHGGQEYSYEELYLAKKAGDTKKYNEILSALKEYGLAESNKAINSGLWKAYNKYAKENNLQQFTYDELYLAKSAGDYKKYESILKGMQQYGQAMKESDVNAGILDAYNRYADTHNMQKYTYEELLDAKLEGDTKKYNTVIRGMQEYGRDEAAILNTLRSRYNEYAEDIGQETIDYDTLYKYYQPGAQRQSTAFNNIYNELLSYGKTEEAIQSQLNKLRNAELKESDRLFSLCTDARRRANATDNQADWNEYTSLRNQIVAKYANEGYTTQRVASIISSMLNSNENE